MAVSLFMMLRSYPFIKTLFFAVGSAVGFGLAIVLVAAIYEKLDLVGDIPKGLKGPGIIIIITGIIALAFMGFSGMVSIS
jgi:Na+-transporting NADH:ubiquinone oxidoreductase subunit E